MSVKEAIERRRSIRKYKDRPISDEIIKELIEAARLAPSGTNAQPWKFYVIKDGKTIRRLKARNAFNQDFVYKCPVIIVCCGDPSIYKGLTGVSYQIKDGTLPKDEKTRKAWLKAATPIEDRLMRDLSIASSFLVLRATELGLGTCFVGFVDRTVLKTELGIPEEFLVPYVITVGYADESPNQRPRKNIDEIILK